MQSRFIMETSEISASEHHPYYTSYIERAKSKDLIESLKASGDQVLAYFKSIPSAMADMRYREGSWSVNQLIQHVNDAERIFAYRACCLARGEQTSLPGFEENLYAEAEMAPELSLNDRIEEFRLLRASSILLFIGFTPSVLLNQSLVNDSNISVRAIGRIMVGHALHHKEVLQERYEPNWK